MSALRRFEPYPAYKDSGVEWLGEIPAGWKLVPSTWLFAEGKQRALYGDQQLSATQKYGVIPQAEFERLEGRQVVHAFLHLDQRKHVELDDFVMSMRSFEGGLERVRARGCVRSSYIALRCSGEVHVGFFSFLFKSSAYIQALRSTSNFIRDGQDLNFENFRLVRLPLIPVGEQEAIAASLDQETARIDALVAKKERLIELLQEQRTALITRAVTKGLDPNVPMKDSGVEWLGEIPTHWEVVPLKRLLIRCDYGISESLAGTGDVRVLTMAHIQDGKVILPESGSLDEIEDEFILDQHDLLFNRTNSRELVGKVGMFRGSRSDMVSFASYLVRMTARDEISPTYLNLVLNSLGLLGLARSMAMLSVNQANLNPTRYTQIRVPRPARGEQDAIAAFLDRETARIDALVAKVRDAIERLKELRTALISAAVTGKIDVREEVA